MVECGICGNSWSTITSTWPRRLPPTTRAPERVQQYNGVPPYRETHAYVARIIKDYNRKKLAEQKQLAEAKAQRHRAQATRPSLAQTAAQPADDAH